MASRSVAEDRLQVLSHALSVACFRRSRAVPALSFPASAPVAPQGTDPIRLALTLIQSNPVTTITVGGQAVQAIVDMSENIRVVQALVDAGAEEPPVPNAIGEHFLSQFLLSWTTRAHRSACGRLIRRTLRALTVGALMFQWWPRRKSGLLSAISKRHRGVYGWFGARVTAIPCFQRQSPRNCGSRR